MSSRATTTGRAAFTLVELLVVVAIIGVLAAILVPTLASAIQTAQEGAIVQELSQLEMAMEDYRQKNGGAFPPDFTPGVINDRTLVDRLTGHVRKISNKYNTNDLTAANGFLNNIDVVDNDYTTPAGTPMAPQEGIQQSIITPDEALVFWLWYTRTDVEFPLTGGGPTNPGYDMPSPLPMGTTHVEIYETIKDDARSYFEFDEARLVDFDDDGYPSYVPPYGPHVPYVYFDSRTYILAQFDASNVNPGVMPAKTIPEGQGVAQAIAERIVTIGMSQSIKWQGDDKFQIVWSGFDGHYGEFISYGTVMMPNYSQIKLFPEGRNIRPNDRDNFGSFANGRYDKKLDN